MRTVEKAFLWLVMPIPHPSPEPKQPSRQQAVNTAFYLDTLHRLINMASDLAGVVHRQAMAAADAAEDAVLAGGPVPAATNMTDVAIAFERIARTIRRTVVLARHVAEPLPQRAAGHDAGHAARQRTAARKLVIRQIEDAIHFRARSSDEAESLEAELLERLDGPDLDDWSADRGRPVEDVINDIRADLGLETMPGLPPRKRRTPADIAVLCARAVRPRRPAASNRRRRIPGRAAIRPRPWPTPRWCATNDPTRAHPHDRRRRMPERSRTGRLSVLLGGPTPPDSGRRRHGGHLAYPS